jgi:hypothetical protein
MVILVLSSPTADHMPEVVLLHRLLGMCIGLPEQIPHTLCRKPLNGCSPGLGSIGSFLKSWNKTPYFDLTPPQIYSAFTCSISMIFAPFKKSNFPRSTPFILRIAYAVVI